MNGSITLDSTVHVPEHVVSRGFGEELVLLNLETGQYHGVNGTGREMIDALKSATTVRSLTATIAEQFDQPLEHVEADVLEFLTSMLERGLVAVDGDG